MPASRREVKNLRALPGIVHRCCGRRGEYLFRDRREISPEKTFFRPLLPRMMSATTLLVADGGLVYSFLEARLEGRIVLLVLFRGPIFSWSVLIAKLRYLHYPRHQVERF